jgi:DNA replication and repair protein RecF
MVGVDKRRLDLIVETVSLRNIRSYARLELELAAGLVLVVGPNGAGKTNLLESLHVGTQGFSPRTRAESELIRFGEQAGRVALRGARGAVAVDLEVVLALGEGKRAKLNGAALRAAEQLRTELATLVFTPDLFAARTSTARSAASLRPARRSRQSTALRLRSGTPPCAESRRASPLVRRSRRGPSRSRPWVGSSSRPGRRWWRLLRAASRSSARTSAYHPPG